MNPLSYPSIFAYARVCVIGITSVANVEKFSRFTSSIQAISMQNEFY